MEDGIRMTIDDAAAILSTRVRPRTLGDKPVVFPSGSTGRKTTGTTGNRFGLTIRFH